MRPNLLTTILTLSLAILSVGDCAPAKTQEEAESRSVSQKVEDAAVTARLKTTYLFNRHLNSFRINVDTTDGVVTLRGVVREDIQKDLAGAIAKSVNSVKSVHNELRVGEGAVEEPEEVERTFSQAVLDATTTTSVKTALALAKGVKASQIDVTTLWGTVTLAGTVATKAERELARKTVEDVSGVKEVVNKIKVRG